MVQIKIKVKKLIPFIEKKIRYLENSTSHLAVQQSSERCYNIYDMLNFIDEEDYATINEVDFEDFISSQMN